LGEPTYNETRAKAINLENHIVVVGLEFLDLDREQNGITEQLKEMQKGVGMYLWPKLIFHLDKPPCDVPNMIIMKPYGLCQQWYHCFDIIVTSCLHTYHPGCLGKHLKTNNRCKVCN
jgi:hypothetical protein